jgi:hypothetical protein
MQKKRRRKSHAWAPLSVFMNMTKLSKLFSSPHQGPRRSRFLKKSRGALQNVVRFFGLFFATQLHLQPRLRANFLYSPRYSRKTENQWCLRYYSDFRTSEGSDTAGTLDNAVQTTNFQICWTVPLFQDKFKGEMLTKKINYENYN